MGRVSHVWIVDLGRMRIGIVTPAPPGSRYGNRITALRWARILRRLGNRVSILEAYVDQSFDLLVALHARRSHASIISFQRQNPAAPVVVALTGTDLYRYSDRSFSARVARTRDQNSRTTTKSHRRTAATLARQDTCLLSDASEAEF